MSHRGWRRQFGAALCSVNWESRASNVVIAETYPENAISMQAFPLSQQFILSVNGTSSIELTESSEKEPETLSISIFPKAM